MKAPGCVFGLTGGVACGKSTVAQFFEELGARIIDADRVGHETLRSPHPAYQQIVARFGRGILDSAGEIDRRRLGTIVFADDKARHDLNAIVHPQILARIDELAAQFHTQDSLAVILVDAALIYEVGISGRFKKILVAWCRPEQQIERLMAKTGMSLKEVALRIAAQMPSEEKRRSADYVIDCSGSKENTRVQVQSLYPELRKWVVVE